MFSINRVRPTSMMLLLFFVASLLPGGRPQQQLFQCLNTNQPTALCAPLSKTATLKSKTLTATDANAIDPGAGGGVVTLPKTYQKCLSGNASLCCPQPIGATMVNNKIVFKINPATCKVATFTN